MPYPIELQQLARSATPGTTAVYNPGNGVPTAIRVQATWGGSHKLLYVAYNGCGQAHDFAKLEELKGEGIRIEYINANSPDNKGVRMAVEPTPPGIAQEKSYEQGVAELAGYGKTVTTGEILLINANGKLVKGFRSQDPNFVQEVRKAIAEDLQKGRQLGGGRAPG